MHTLKRATTLHRSPEQIFFLSISWQKIQSKNIVCLRTHQMRWLVVLLSKHRRILSSMLPVIIVVIKYTYTVLEESNPFFFFLTVKVLKYIVYRSKTTDFGEGDSIAGAADRESDAISRFAIVAAVKGPSMQGKPERRLAATKHHHTHFRQNVRVCACSPTLHMRMLGFSGLLRIRGEEKS